jgi:YhcH/YjgK/YiaL family protein
MIIDTVCQASRYFALHPYFEKAFEWLEHNPHAEIGRYEIDGDVCFVMVQRVDGRGHIDPLMEAHNRYLDIQVVLEGTEEIGWKPRAACTNVKQEYDAETDVALWSEAPAFYVSLAPRQFAILYPDDAHAPISGEGEVLKAVFKIQV